MNISSFVFKHGKISEVSLSEEAIRAINNSMGRGCGVCMAIAINHANHGGYCRPVAVTLHNGKEEVFSVRKQINHIKTEIDLLR